MQSIPDIDGWLDAAVVIAVALIAGVPSWFAIRAHKTSAEVLHQTRNGHKVPLRADLDRAIEAIDRLAHDVSAIRQDLADEESRRRNHVAELREEVHRKISDIHDRIK